MWRGGVRNNPCHLFRCEKICRKIKHLQVWELLHKRQIVVRNRAPGKRELFHACVCKRHHTMNLTEPLKYGILLTAHRRRHILMNTMLTVLVHNSCQHKSSSWRKQKSDYWKANKDTISDLYDLSGSNVALMSKGKAPIGFDGHRIELHHVDGIANSSRIIPMTKASHTILHKYIGYSNFLDYIINMNKVISDYASGKMSHEEFEAELYINPELWNDIQSLVPRDIADVHCPFRQVWGNIPGFETNNYQVKSTVTSFGYNYSMAHGFISALVKYQYPDVVCREPIGESPDSLLEKMLMYGKEASNRKQEIDRQHYTIPNQRPKDKHCGKI